MNKIELKSYLDFKVEQYNTLEFIDTDPIQIPHQFSKKEDIEIAGFLTATIAWGNRKSILKNADKMMELMERSPYDFILNHSPADLEPLNAFVHRTFNGADFQFFISALRNIYLNHGGIENIFNNYAEDTSVQRAIHHFKQIFFELPHARRTEKHVSDPLKNSAAKRLNMYLRWMV